jgi:protein gp37
MAKKSKIQWCDSTVNPVMGCQGCELWTGSVKRCYAGDLHRMRSKHKGFASTFEVPELFPGRTTEIARAKDLTGTFRPDKPWLDGLPRLIFVSDMGDALSKSVSFDYLRQEVVDVAESDKGCRHHWLWLTKRPGRMAQFSDWLVKNGREWPANLWAGTSVTGPDSYGRARCLLSVGNDETVRFLSVEPQLSAVDLQSIVDRYNWIIHGGESSTRGDARPFQIEWAMELRSVCADAGVPYFLKQLGSNVWHGDRRMSFKDGHGGDWAEWPSELKVRQMPNCQVASLA